jgi:hypothetical protein
VGPLGPDVRTGIIRRELTGIIAPEEMLPTSRLGEQDFLSLSLAVQASFVTFADTAGGNNPTKVSYTLVGLFSVRKVVIDMESDSLGLLPTLFTYHDAIEAGVSKRRLYAMRDAGQIEQVARGIFMRSDSDELVDLDLAEIAIRAPDATLCLSTALVRHDLTDANPAAIDVAVPSGSHRPVVSPPVKWHRFDTETFTIGRNSLPIYAEHNIGIYSAERCIVDAFRLRWSEGDDLAYIALRRWLSRRGSQPAALYEMARNFPKALPAILKAVQTLTYE